MNPACSSIWSSVIPMASKSLSTFWTAGSDKSIVEFVLLRPGEGCGGGVFIATDFGGMMDCGGAWCEAEDDR